MKTGLASLIHPYSIAEFMTFYKNNEPLLSQPKVEHLKAITDLPFLNSLEALLSSWPHSIEVHLPDVRDESSSIETNQNDAIKFFSEGTGLLFNEAQNISPLLGEWLQEIRKDLGLSALTYGRSLIYATPDGKGTAPHFDQNINFVLQIHGTKVWKMAPNQHVTNPLTRHVMGTIPDPEMMGYLEKMLPTQMPNDAKEFELTPGSLLFVPRGYWHGTEAKGDALALNFTFTAPTWIDLFTAALRSRLALSPEWRETADDIFSPNAEHELDHLLSTLVGDLPHWHAADILEVTEAESL